MCSFQKAAVQKKKINEAQSAMARAQLNARDPDEDSDEEDTAGIYETLWDAVTPPTKKTDTSKFDLTQCHIEDFNMIKVLGKGSFGKVYIDKNIYR